MNTHWSARTWPYPRYSDFSTVVHQAASEWLLARGYETNPKYPYILADWEDWPSNIILPEVSQFIQDKSVEQRKGGNNFPLHKYLHHGLSSQALLFNLIGPLLTRRDLTSLQKLLERKGVNLMPHNVFLHKTGKTHTQNR